MADNGRVHPHHVIIDSYFQEGVFFGRIAEYGHSLTIDQVGVSLDLSFSAGNWITKSPTEETKKRAKHILSATTME
jgi:hypothetical protein